MGSQEVVILATTEITPYKLDVWMLGTTNEQFGCTLWLPDNKYREFGLYSNMIDAVFNGLIELHALTNDS